MNDTDTCYAGGRGRGVLRHVYEYRRLDVYAKIQTPVILEGEVGSTEACL